MPCFKGCTMIQSCITVAPKPASHFAKQLQAEIKVYPFQMLQKSADDGKTAFALSSPHMSERYITALFSHFRFFPHCYHLATGNLCFHWHPLVWPDGHWHAL